MNLLVVDTGALALDLCLKAQAAGHRVKWFIAKDPDTGKDLPVGEGLVDKVKDWHPWVKWADLIFVADNIHLLKELDVLRRRGVKIIGPSFASAELELDRKKGQDFFKKHGIKIIESKEFSDYGKAEKYVRAEMKRFVSKPSGEADKALSYVSKSPADMLFMLNRWRETNKLKSEFILQEFVPGIEIAVGGWLGPNGFAELFLENFEHKKLMNGELGPNTGEQGTVAKYVKNSALADYLLKPMEASLVAMGHTGYFDMAAICDDEGNLWPLESTSRCGYPTLNLQIAMHTGDPVEWMLDLVNGVDTLTATDEVCTGVVMAIPDFPYSKLTKKEVSGYPIYNLSEVEAADIHHCETMRGKAPKMEGDTLRDDAPMFVTAGDYVLVATGLGETVQESMKAVYKVLDTIEMPNSAFWRTDIGKRVVKQLPKLQAMGYCAEWPD